MNILCLSATIPNIEQFAKWLESIHKKPFQIVIEDKRPVPLHFSFQCSNSIIDKIDRMKGMRHTKANKLKTLIDYILSRDGFPCIYFVFGRRRAEDLAFELYGQSFLTQDERVKIMALYDSLCSRFNLTHEKSATTLSHLVKNGVAYHHAGMLPTLKEIVERLFTSRLLKVIFTTETFALGINMPSRSVVFDGLQKFYGRYVRDLKTRDFYQMAGRAGRRGVDKEGFVYTRVNLHRIGPENLKRIIHGKNEEVRSQWNTSYATILNLYEKYKDDLFKIYPLSLHFFQTRPNQQKEALRLMGAKLSLLKDMDYIADGALASKGKFAKAVYGYELILSELYADGLFEGLDEIGLGVIASGCVFEPRKNQRLMGLSKASREISVVAEETYNKIRHKESHSGIRPFSKPPFFHMAQAIEAWMRGAAFAKILRFTDSDEGEVVRYFRMSVQILREISDVPISEELKAKLGRAIILINRDIIDAERQLRESQE